MKKLNCIAICLVVVLAASGCRAPQIEKVSKNISQVVKTTLSGDGSPAISKTETVISLPDILSSSDASVDVTKGFEKAIKSAVSSDPAVLAAKKVYEQRLAAVGITKSQMDFQVSGTAYGGVEDLTDETVGLAVVLNANKLLFDGGQLRSQITANELAAKAALNNYHVTADEKSLEAAMAWVELERYQGLSDLIDSRLVVLDPLITQLEQVAKAGIGDVSQVAAAQRTVSLIRVTQTDVEERLEQAKVNFLAIFGSLPAGTDYAQAKISNAVPANITDAVIEDSPALKAQYAAYQSAFSGLKSLEMRDSYTVFFESKLQRPIGGSTVDSDESFGLVASKTLFDGRKLASEVDQARANVETQLELLRSTYRQGRRLVSNAQQTISSMDKAVVLSKISADNTREEISYLRKQLVIGQSTLDSVLSAEARLYDAESKEINFLAERRRAELTILSALGVLAKLFGIS